MASQQVQFAETIRAMKIALKRKADDSDSDTEIQAHTNRGHKLQRAAKYMHEGRRLTDLGLAYRKKVEHAGYTRYTIARNPPLYDADGDPFDPTVSDDEREAEPIEEDAFGSVQLEYLLRPLTAASELPDHPSLSVPYKSKALTQMAAEAQQMLRREENLLWKAKRLLRRFRGDADWVPGEAFEMEQDDMMLLPNDRSAEGAESAVPSVQEGMMDIVGDSNGLENGDQEATGVDQMDGVDAMHMALQQAAAEAEKTAREAEAAAATTEQRHAENSADTHKNAEEEQSKALGTDPTTLAAEVDAQNNTNDQQEAASEHTSNSGKDTTKHAMTTRARARSPQISRSPSPTPSDSASVGIHPWFLVPPTSLPEPNLGLPANEAEETRRLLILYTQKQEQVVRNLSMLYTGLAKADRLRRNVLNACRAEGHVRADGKGGVVTEMSDGEDWYDVEALGLDRGSLKNLGGGVWGLEKGKDEVEDVEEEGRRGGRRRRVHRM
jgi:hypothetical protein